MLKNELLKNENMFADFDIWTDGGYDIATGKGAYSYVILDENGVEVCRHAERVEHSTNNRCELMAVYEALRTIPMGSVVRVHTDSQYAIGVLSHDFRRKKNLDLLEMYDALVWDAALVVHFKWVRGHSGDALNELCDAMCVEAMEDEIEKRKEIWIMEEMEKLPHIFDFSD